VHGTILSECDKGDGYPMILSEAHERAVIRGPERELFYRLLERSLQDAGQPVNTSSKHASKQVPRV
jgi:NurA-like 5'-3' nuclease